MRTKIIFLSLLNFLSTLIIAQDIAGIFSKSYGNEKNPAIIFLHGGPGYNSVSFELSTAQVLADKGYFVIVFDQRGCGRSKGVKNSQYTKDEALADINTLYKKYHIKKASLIGHSWGGILATWYTEKFPNKVHSLILTDAPLSLQKTFKTIIGTCRKIYTEQNSPDLKYIEMLEKMDSTSLEYSSYCFYHAIANRNSFYSPKNPSEESKEIYRKMMASADAKYLSDLANEPVSGFYNNEHYTKIDLTETLKRITISKKVYGIYGKEDGLYGKDQLDSIKSILGESNFKIIINASHNVFIDQQVEFINCIIKFVN
jgi:proline iminopeptidase